MSQVQDTEKRSRSGNFSKIEVKLLLKLANSNKGILENKKTDSRTNKLKARAWDQLEKDFNNQTQERPRSLKVLKAKYESIKRELRKKSQDWRKTGGPREKSPSPLLEEEEELRETILSCDGMAPLPQDSDYNPEVPEGKEDFCSEEEMDDDWETYHPSMLQTLCHPILSTNLTSEVSPTISTTITNHATSTTAPITSVTSPTGTTSNNLSRQLPGFKRRSAMFEELVEKKLKIADIKLETANIDKKTAETNLAIAQAKLRMVLHDEECQKRGPLV
uniref:Regulatory protein zeste n=1 Tax=Cacopsylla melanoneura TaxID=428564 RepID=A0A8D9EWJ5_9HEMI